MKKLIKSQGEQEKNSKKISLDIQIKKVIGNRILFCSIAFMIIIFGLTLYDLSISIKQLRARVNEQIKPIEDFAIDQAMINNLETVELKIESFNETNKTFKVEWIRKGIPIHNNLAWAFPLTWIYDYPIGDIAGYQFGYFKISGGFLSDKALIYDLLFRLILLVIFAISILIILFPLAKKIPEQLFLNPINRFIDLVSNNTAEKETNINTLPVELEMLEAKILSLLKTAREHERNKAAIELGHLSARLAHDIHSPLVAMEMGLQLLTKEAPEQDLKTLRHGIQSVRDIANNVLERYRNPHKEMNLSTPNPFYDDGNIVRPILLLSLVKIIVSQKRQEWHQQPCNLILTVEPKAQISWIKVAPNEVKRLLSNLLNNSYDAIRKKSEGLIHLTIDECQGSLHLQIKDNGIGIPREKIPDVLNGLSLKHTGKGLGLSGAQQYMKNLEGKLEITSTGGQGTIIKLIFPQENNLSWFPKDISLIKSRIVIVLDDDVSMLTYWQQRISDAGFTLKLFLSSHTALEWIANNEALVSSAIFLADYDLSTDTINGLTFLEKFKNNPNRYLITSYAEEFLLQKAVKDAGVWLIPKSVIGEIALNF